MSQHISKLLNSIRRAASSTLRLQSSGRTGKVLSISLLMMLALLAACTSAAPAATSTSLPSATPVTPTATNTPVPTATSAATAAPLSTGKPIALDPCQLITSQEASTLAGASFGPGKEGTLGNNSRTCAYGSQTTNVFEIEVAQAPDVATAIAEETDFIAEVNSSMQELSSGGFTVTKLPSYADGAISGQFSKTVNGVSLSGIDFAFRKGTVFFGFSDVVDDKAAPTLAQMQLMANTVLTRLP